MQAVGNVDPNLVPLAKRRVAAGIILVPGQLQGIARVVEPGAMSREEIPVAPVPADMHHDSDEPALVIEDDPVPVRVSPLVGAAIAYGILVERSLAHDVGEAPDAVVRVVVSMGISPPVRTKSLGGPPAESAKVTGFYGELCRFTVIH